MRNFLVADKPSTVQLILRHIVANAPSPESEWMGTAVPPHWLLGQAFRFPRGKSYDAYPLVDDPEYQPIDALVDEDSQVSGGQFGGKRIVGGEVVSLTPQPGRRCYDVEDDLKAADRIMMVFDGISASQHGALRAYEHIRRQNGTATIDWHILRELSDASVAEALLTPVTIDEARRLSQPSVIKRFFDYNFLNNRNVIIRRTFTMIGLPKYSRLPSKFGIQLLYWLSDIGGSVDRKALSSVMARWPGTGRYNRTAVSVDGVRHRFCSWAAEWAVVQDLVDGTLVTRKADGEVTLTEAGMAFLSALHPDCRDLDLPYRIRGWQVLPYDISRKQIARYINTWFSKQKRFLEARG